MITNTTPRLTRVMEADSEPETVIIGRWADADGITLSIEPIDDADAELMARCFPPGPGLYIPGDGMDDEDA